MVNLYQKDNYKKGSSLKIVETKSIEGNKVYKTGCMFSTKVS